MGVNASNQIIESVSRTVNTSMTKITNDTRNQSIVDAHSNQRVVVDYTGARLTRCPTTIDQSSAVKAAAWADTNNTLSTQLSNDLTNKIKETITQSLDQVNSGLNIGQANVANAKTSTQTYAENNIQNIINNSISNVVKTNASNNQEVFFYARGMVCVDSPLVINQTSILDIMSKQIATNLVDNTIKNALSNDIAKDIEQKASQVNKGIDLTFGIGALIMIVVLLAFVKVLMGGKKGGAEGPEGIKLPTPLPIKIAKVAVIVIPILLLAGLITYLVLRNKNNKKKNINVPPK